MFDRVRGEFMYSLLNISDLLPAKFTERLVADNLYLSSNSAFSWDILQFDY
jgi:hypothetical protein